MCYTWVQQVYSISNILVIHNWVTILIHLACLKWLKLIKDLHFLEVVWKSGFSHTIYGLSRSFQIWNRTSHSLLNPFRFKATPCSLNWYLYNAHVYLTHHTWRNKNEDWIGLDGRLCLKRREWRWLGWRRNSALWSQAHTHSLLTSAAWFCRFTSYSNF